MPSITAPEFGDAVVDDIDTLSRRASEAADVLREFDPDNDDKSLLLLRVRDDEHLQPVDLERYLDQPRRGRGTATLWDPADFVAYGKRLADLSTTCWADDSTQTITMIVNDHDTAGAAGWRDHRAEFKVRADPDWVAWTGRDGKLSTQEDFADFLEDQAHAVVDPDAATMVEIATTFRATTSAEFGRAVRRDNGDVAMLWKSETTASAGATRNLDIPSKFKVQLTPYIGGDPLEVTARLRYRQNEGSLRIGFKLHRPDLIKQAAFQTLRGNVAEQLAATDEFTGVPVYLGPAPVHLLPAETIERVDVDTSAATRKIDELRRHVETLAYRR